MLVTEHIIRVPVGDGGAEMLLVAAAAEMTLQYGNYMGAVCMYGIRVIGNDWDNFTVRQEAILNDPVNFSD